jgi:hypothetical protein
MISIAPLGGVLLAVAASFVLVHRRRRNARLPPGPKGYPLIGNVLDIPLDVPLWKVLTAMGEKYSKLSVLATWLCELRPASTDSDVLYLNLLGADHVILNSGEAISDLLDKRSAIYSDRVSGF